MPLEILVPVALLSVALLAVLGLVILAKRFGAAEPFQLTGEHTRTAWLRDVADDVPTKILIASNRENALLGLASGKLGLVRVIGAGTSTHDLTGATWEHSETALILRLRDVGLPELTIPLTPSEQAVWASLKGATPQRRGHSGL